MNGETMSSEQIKEIVIALINNGLMKTSADNEETAKEIAKFINTLRNETAREVQKETPARRSSGVF